MAADGVLHRVDLCVLLDDVGQVSVSWHSAADISADGGMQRRRCELPGEALSSVAGAFRAVQPHFRAVGVGRGGGRVKMRDAHIHTAVLFAHISVLQQPRLHPGAVRRADVGRIYRRGLFNSFLRLRRALCGDGVGEHAAGELLQQCQQHRHAMRVFDSHPVL